MQKKFYLAIVCLVMACTSHAQVKKGDVLLGGSLSLYTTSGSTDQTGISVYPSIGKAIQDNLVLGAQGQYGYLKSSGDGYKNVTKFYGLTGYIRKYRPLGAGFALFLEGDLGFNYQDLDQQSALNTTTPSDYRVKTTAVRAGFTPGLAYTISRRVQIETALQNMVYLNYSHQKNTTSTVGTGSADGHTNTFSLSTNLNQVFNSFLVGVKFVI